MKKNLITSLKKLYAAFGGKDPTKDNAVDIVDKIADSVDNMESMSYEDWQKEDDEKNLYFPKGREGFGAIPVLDINKTKYGDYIYIKETGTDTGFQTGWEEYMATSSTTASNMSNAERLFNLIKSIGVYKFIGNIDNKTALNNFATQLNTEMENLNNSGYFIPAINKQMDFEIVSLGDGTSTIGLSFRNHIVFKYMKTSANDIFFDITVQNYDRIKRSCSIQYNARTNNVVSWRFNDMPTKVLNYNLDTLNKNTYFKYDEDGYFTLAPDNKAEKALVVTITENNNTFTADKTYTELYDAFLDRQIFCLYNGNYYSLTNASSTRIFFTDNSTNPTSITISSDNSITVVE